MENMILMHKNTPVVEVLVYKYNYIKTWQKVRPMV
jgi:hypothetical protein